MGIEERIDKRFIEVDASDTVRTVLDQLKAYEDEHGEAATWLVISLAHPWQFAIVEVTKLREIRSSDWDKSLQATIGGDNGWFERSDVVPLSALVNEGRALEMAHNSPSEVLIVQGVMGLFTEKTLPPSCQTKCPSCGYRQPVEDADITVTCGNTNCGSTYCAVCGGTGTAGPCP
jgi:hypothetical protein